MSFNHNFLEVSARTQFSSNRSPDQASWSKKEFAFGLWLKFKKGKSQNAINLSLHLLPRLWVGRILRPASVVDNWNTCTSLTT